MGSLRAASILVTAIAFFASASTVAATAAPKAKVVPSALPPAPPKWLVACTRLAPATSVLCSLAPLPTILEAARTKSVGRLPLLPYSSMAANGFIWSLYGWLTDSAPVKNANIIGTLLGTYYFREFLKYSPVGSSNLPGTIHHHLLAVTGFVLANVLVVTRFPKRKATTIVGNETVLLFVTLCASPLAALRGVVAARSAAAIPLPFALASAVNCALWSIVGGFALRDFYVTLPSVVGLLCAVAQLVLKGVYRGGA